jgi:hypothetical protein
MHLFSLSLQPCEWTALIVSLSFVIVKENIRITYDKWSVSASLLLCVSGWMLCFRSLKYWNNGSTSLDWFFSTVTETSVHRFYWKVPRLCHFVRQLTVAVNDMSMKNFWRDTDRGIRSTWGNPVPMPLRAPQIPQGLAQARWEAGESPSEP